MQTAKCDKCGREIHTGGGGYFCHNVKQGGWIVTQRWCIPCHEEAKNAGSVPVGLAAQPEMVTVAAAEDVLSRSEVVLSKGMERLL